MDKQQESVISNPLLVSVIPPEFPTVVVTGIKTDSELYPILIAMISYFPSLVPIFRGKGLNNRQKIFLCAFYGTGINISAAQKLTGIYGHSSWKSNDVGYLEAVEQITDIIIDNVEFKLFKYIQADNLSAIQFFLKTKGRHRGYGDKMEVTTKKADMSQQILTALKRKYAK